MAPFAELDKHHFRFRNPHHQSRVDIVARYRACGLLQALSQLAKPEPGGSEQNHRKYPRLRAGNDPLRAAAIAPVVDAVRAGRRWPPEEPYFPA